MKSIKTDVGLDQLPDRRVCRLRVGQGLRLDRPPALSAQGLDDEPERLAAARVPDAIRFVTKPQIAAAMIERPWRPAYRLSGWPPTPSMGPWPCSCAELARVTCWAFKPQTASVLGQEPAGGRHGRALHRGCSQDLQRLSAGIGTKGPRLLIGPMSRWLISGRGIQRGADP